MVGVLAASLGGGGMAVSERLSPPLFLTLLILISLSLSLSLSLFLTVCECVCIHMVMGLYFHSVHPNTRSICVLIQVQKRPTVLRMKIIEMTSLPDSPDTDTTGTRHTAGQPLLQERPCTYHL